MPRGLVKCPTCEHSVSVRAVTCPRCGEPLMETPLGSLVAYAIAKSFLLVGGLILAWFSLSRNLLPFGGWFATLMLVAALLSRPATYSKLSDDWSRHVVVAVVVALVFSIAGVLVVILNRDSFGL